MVGNEEGGIEVRGRERGVKRKVGWERGRKITLRPQRIKSKTHTLPRE